MLFGWSGCFLPLLISAGIFGDDIASGRISVLITKPMRVTEFYMSRIIGLSIQGGINISLSAGIILTLHRATGKGNINNFALWVLSSWLLFSTWAALSTSLSVVVKRTHNSMILGVAAVAAFFLVGYLPRFAPGHIVSKVVLPIIKYAFPPVELQIAFCTGSHRLFHVIGYITHALGLTVLYCIIGIILLSRREFRCERD